MGLGCPGELEPTLCAKSCSEAANNQILVTQEETIFIPGSTPQPTAGSGRLAVFI
jgi:hypothetical protein